NYELQIKTVTEAVPTKSTELLCPTCGGHLTVNDELQRVECRFCGYTAPNRQHHGEEALTMALLKRRAQPVIWNVGKRLVRCGQWGAEHTITAEKLSTRCRFCGSAEVLLSDALDSFEQPECLIPFKITPAQAKDAVEKQLNSLSGKLM